MISTKAIETPSRTETRLAKSAKAIHCVAMRYMSIPLLFNRSTTAGEAL
jgi:hypothetical protein